MVEKDQEQGERHAQPVAALEAQVDGQQEQDPGGDLDAEVVRVAGESVDPVDEGSFDRAEDVDLAGAAGDRLEPGFVEIRARRLGDRELCEPVGPVRGDPSDEGGEREPVEAQPAPRDQRDAGDEEQEMQEELDHPFRPLREGLRRLEVEPPDQVHEEKGHEERERHGRSASHVSVESLDPVDRERDDEDERDDVREGHRPGDLPLELREGDGEDGREEQPLDEGGALGDGARAVEGDGCHARVMVRRVAATSAQPPDGQQSHLRDAVVVAIDVNHAQPVVQRGLRDQQVGDRRPVPQAVVVGEVALQRRAHGRRCLGGAAAMGNVSRSSVARASYSRADRVE